MNLEELRRRLAATREGLRHLAGLDELDDTQAREFDWLDAEERWLSTEETELVRRQERRDEVRQRIEAGHAGFERPEDGIGTRSVNVNAGRSNEDPFDTSDVRIGTPVGELRGRARRAIERVEHLTDEQRQRATEILERAEARDGRLSRHLLVTGRPAYRSAFQKVLAGESYALTAEEQRAVQEVRASSLTDAAGGFAVPFTLDPTLITTDDGSVNPFRTIGRVVQITTDTWNGVSTAGITASYDAEATEVSDDAPTLAQPSIPVHKAQAFVPYSIEIGQDWPGFQNDMRMLLSEAKDDLEASKFAVGSGTNEPTGIVTALDGTASEVAPTTAETFAVADLYKLEEALGPKYRARASWVANRAIYNDVRQFDTSGGTDLWVRLAAGLPPELIGYPAFEASAMDSGFDPAVTADNFLAILGDFRNFVIVDRIGMSVELVPHLFGANNRPTGQRGIYAYWRNGSDSVNDAGFSMLNVATTL